MKHGQGRALDEQDVEGAQCFVLVETSGGKKEHDEEVGQIDSCYVMLGKS